MKEIQMESGRKRRQPRKAVLAQPLWTIETFSFGEGQGY
jgi:hypothetical protein